MDFEKIVDRVPYFVANCPIWRDCGDQHHNAIAREQLGDKSESADVLVAVFAAEAKITVQVFSHGVSIQHLGPNATSQQFCMDCLADGCLTRSAQAREPDGQPLQTLVCRTAAIG